MFSVLLGHSPKTFVLWRLCFFIIKNKIKKNPPSFYTILFFPYTNHNKIGRISILIKAVSGKVIYYNHKSIIDTPIVKNEVLETSQGSSPASEFKGD